MYYSFESAQAKESKSWVTLVLKWSHQLLLFIMNILCFIVSSAPNGNDIEGFLGLSLCCCLNNILYQCWLCIYVKSITMGYQWIIPKYNLQWPLCSSVTCITLRHESFALTTSQVHIGKYKYIGVMELCPCMLQCSASCWLYTIDHTTVHTWLYKYIK